MRQAEFAELSREVMPVLDKLTEIAGQHGTAEKLVSITLSVRHYEKDKSLACGRYFRKKQDYSVKVRKGKGIKDGTEND